MQKRRKISKWIYSTFLIVSIFTFGCNDSAPPKPIISYSPSITEEAQVGEDKTENAEKWEELFDTSQYFYTIKSSRDPFESPISKIRAPEKERRRTPLEKWDIGKYKLIATLYTKNVNLAMVEDPDGNGFVLRKGLKIGLNNGFVVGISNKEVVVRERAVGRRGRFTERTIKFLEEE